MLAITESSNLATNLLVDRLGAERINATMAALGAPTLVVRRGVEDDAAWRAGLNNTVTAGGLATLLLAIARGEAVSPAACVAMLAILRAQAFNEGIPAGLPADVVVAHKTGSITDLYHDAADRGGAGRSPVRARRADPGARGDPDRAGARRLDRPRGARGARHAAPDVRTGLFRVDASSSRSASSSTRFDTDEHTSGPKPFRASSA